MTKKIQITDSKVALVDDEDFEHVNQFKWKLQKKGRHRNIFYAIRFDYEKTSPGNYNLEAIFMHRFILNPPKGTDVDHINGDGLDNRRSNLRVVTHRQNLQNRHVKKTSKYPGVYWHKRDRKWCSQIYVNGEKKHLGNFKNEERAFRAYKNAVHELTDEKLINEI